MEFALVFPILLLIVVGILEFGLAFRTFQVVTNAAREGARTAVLGTDADGVGDVVDRYLRSGGLDLQRGDLVFECEPQAGSAPPAADGSFCTTGEIARVQLTYPIRFPVLGVLINLAFDNPQVRSTSEMRTE